MAKSVAKTYGQALFDLGIEDGSIESYAQQAQTICSLFKENPELLKFLTHPEIAKEEKIVKYIGVPDYDYYAENITDFVNCLKSDKDLYVVQKEEITDKSIIDTMLKEQYETGRITKFVENETEEHEKEIKEMQKRVEADEKNNQQIIGTVKVYYKIYFKDQSFPFRLILY